MLSEIGSKYVVSLKRLKKFSFLGVLLEGFGRSKSIQWVDLSGLVELLRTTRWIRTNQARVLSPQRVCSINGHHVLCVLVTFGHSVSMKVDFNEGAWTSMKVRGLQWLLYSSTKVLKTVATLSKCDSVWNPLRPGVTRWNPIWIQYGRQASSTKVVDKYGSQVSSTGIVRYRRSVTAPFAHRLDLKGFFLLPLRVPRSG